MGEGLGGKRTRRLITGGAAFLRLLRVRMITRIYVK